MGNNTMPFKSYGEAAVHHEQVGGFLICGDWGYTVVIEDCLDLKSRYSSEIWAKAGWDETNIKGVG